MKASNKTVRKNNLYTRSVSSNQTLREEIITWDGDQICQSKMASKPWNHNGFQIDTCGTLFSLGNNDSNNMRSPFVERNYKSVNIFTHNRPFHGVFLKISKRIHIHLHCWKDSLKIRQLTKFKGDIRPNRAKILPHKVAKLYRRLFGSDFLLATSLSLRRSL